METAANHADSDYLKVYREFFEEVVGKINPVDQLPVRVSPCNVTDSELVGQIVYLTLQYIKQPKWPLSLQGYIVRLVVDEVKAMCRNHPEDCGLNSDKKTYKPLRLMQAVTSKVNEIFNRYLDNSRLATLPPPATAYVPLARTATLKNQRRKLEDRHIEIYDLHAIFDIQDDSLASYYAVFDGHGGDDAAEYCAMHLHQYLVESTFYPTDPERALRDAFITTDTRFIEKLKTRKVSGGTTALCTLILHKKLYIAWVGDSSAIMTRHGVPEVLVNPHRLSRNDEYERVYKMGGMLLYYQGTMRINGLLAVSRAIGDFEFKPYVTSEPDVRCVSLDGTEDFLILATDGFWDFVTKSDATKLVYLKTRQYPDNPEYVTRHLAELAKFTGSQDNITVTVIFLTPPQEIAAKALNSLDMTYVQRDHVMDIVKNDSMFKILDEELATRDQHEGPYDNEQERHVHHHHHHYHHHHHQHNNQRHENGTDSSLDTSEYHHEIQSRGKRENDSADYDYLDLGPETDVDAIDDVDNVLVNSSGLVKEREETPLDNDVSRELCHEEKQPRVANNENKFLQQDDAPLLDDDDSPPSPANVNAKPLQHALLSEADNVADSEDSEDEWNYFRIGPNKEKDTLLSDEVRESKDDSNESHGSHQQQPDQDNNVEIQSAQFEQNNKRESPKKEVQKELINTDISTESKVEVVDSAFEEETKKGKEEEEREEGRKEKEEEDETEEKLDLQEQQQQQLQQEKETEVPQEQQQQQQHLKEKTEDSDEQQHQVLSQQEQEHYANMDFQLNPDAAEFVPGSPSNCQVRMNLMHDSLVAGSPLKSVAMDDITVPSQKEFEDEVCTRPKDLEESDSANGEHNTRTDYSDFFTDRQKIAASVSVAALDESEISSTKAEFGDESTMSFLGTTTDLHKTEMSAMEESFGNSECEYYNKENLMTMSYTPCDFKAAFEKGGETVDLNAVHDLDDADLEDDLFEKRKTSPESTVANEELCYNSNMAAVNDDSKVDTADDYEDHLEGDDLSKNGRTSPQSLLMRFELPSVSNVEGANDDDDDDKRNDDQDSCPRSDGQSPDLVQASSISTRTVEGEENMFLGSGDVDEPQQSEFLQANFKRQSSPISLDQITDKNELQEECLLSTESLNETDDIETKREEQEEREERKEQEEREEHEECGKVQKNLENCFENEKDVSEKTDEIETATVENEMGTEVLQEVSFRDQGLLSQKVHETTKSLSSMEDTPKSVSPILDETAEYLEETKKQIVFDEPSVKHLTSSSHPVVEDCLISHVEENLKISSTIAQEDEDSSLTSNLRANASVFCPNQSSFVSHAADEPVAAVSSFVEAPIMQNPLDIISQMKSTISAPSQSIFVSTEKQQEHTETDKLETQNLLEINETIVTSDIYAKDNISEIISTKDDDVSEERKIEISQTPDVNVEDVTDKISQNVEKAAICDLQFNKQIDESNAMLVEVAEVAEVAEEVVNVVLPMKEVTGLKEQPVQAGKVELKESAKSESHIMEEQKLKKIAQPEQKTIADEVIATKEEPEQQTIEVNEVREQINEKLETASLIEFPTETVDKIAEAAASGEKTAKTVIPEKTAETAVPEKTVESTESQKFKEICAKSTTLAEETAAIAAAAATAAAAIAAGAAAAVVTVGAPTMIKTKSKPTTTKSSKPTSTLSSKTAPKSTPTSPSKTVTSTTRPTSTTATKKTSTSAATRPKQLDTAPKNTTTSSTTKASTTKVTAAAASKNLSTKTTAMRPSSGVSKASKPSSSGTAVEKKSTPNGDVKLLKSTAATGAKGSKSATSTLSTHVSSTTKTVAAAVTTTAPKTSTSASRTSTGGVTTPSAKNRSFSVTTTRSPPKSSTTGPVSGSTATTKPKSAAISTTTSSTSASTNNHVATKTRTSATTKIAASVMIDKQVKETANKQISMARSSTASATAKSSTRTSVSATTISVTSATTKRLSSALKSTTNAAALSPAKKTTGGVSKTAPNSKSTSNTAKSKIIQNGTTEITEHSKDNSIIEKTVGEDLPKKDLSPVVASTDNQLIMSAD